MRLKEKNLLKKFAATLKKFSAQGAEKVEYGSLLVILTLLVSEMKIAEFANSVDRRGGS